MEIKKSDILILLPAFNEASIIESVIADVKAEGYANICVIDDGSSDETKQKALHASTIVLTHLINRGAGAAVQTGLLFAKKKDYKYAVLMDSDGQHLAKDILKLCAKMESTNADIVIGNRFSKSANSIPKHRRLYNSIANIFTNIFSKKKYQDTQSGFRLLNKKALERLQLQNRGFGFCSEMIIIANQVNLQIEETPIQVLYSDYSMSKGQSFFVGIKTARSILWQIIFAKN